MEDINNEDLELRRIRFTDGEGNIVGCFTTVSIVTDPAIELNYQLFNKEIVEQKFQVSSEELMEITGPAIVPDKKILRVDKKTGEKYNVIFTKDDVKIARDIYFRSANHNRVNFEHNQDSYTNKIGLVEAWLVIDENMDKAKALGFDMSKIPVGTLMMTFKVLDESMWEDLKGSNFKGFSVEIGAFEEVVDEEKLSLLAMSNEIDALLESAPMVTVKGKYTLLYSLLKDLMMAEGMDEETKYKLLKKLLTKI